MKTVDSELVKIYINGEAYRATSFEFKPDSKLRCQLSSMMNDLRWSFNKVILVPAPEPKFIGHKVRVNIARLFR